MVTKRLLCPQRARRVPRQFSWVDQRLIFDGHFEHCSAAAWGLYLLLVVVGDSQGLSYYSDRSICRSLSLSLETLEPLREELKAAGVIVYRKPLYQVLALTPPAAPPRQTKRGETLVVGEVLRRIAEGAKR